MGRALHILHVDDDEEIRQIVALSLGLHPETVVTGADCADTAIAAVRAEARPDLLLLDYSIGFDDGIVLLDALRGLPGLTGLPAVFLTGRLREQERARMAASGALGVIRKPFNPLTLAGEIESLLAPGS